MVSRLDSISRASKAPDTSKAIDLVDRAIAQRNDQHHDGDIDEIAGNLVKWIVWHVGSRRK